MRMVRLPLLSGLVGGGVVAAIMLAMGPVRAGSTTTVIQQAPMATNASQVGDALTPAQIYRRAAPGVVLIRAQIVQPSQSALDFFGVQQQGEATGSGFVIDRQGDILTNAHVIDGAIKVTVQLGDQRVVDARIVGKDLSSDLALLRIHPDGVTLRPLALGSAKDVQVGDPTIAIGNPFGLSRTLTTGVVSALQRRITAPNGFSIDNVIQTDAPINPGNSGGPLLDASGRVIGINSQIATGSTGSDGSIGIGFAVPIDTARRVLPQLKSTGTVPHAWLGVSSVSIDGSLRGLGLPVSTGALVQTVDEGSPADRAGIRGGDIAATVSGGQPVTLGGDIITAVNGRPVRSSDQLAAAVEGAKPGDRITLTVLSGRVRRQVPLTLAQRPASLDQGQPGG